MPGIIGGRFELGQKIDEGGMGCVYLGCDTLNNEQVAIKHFKKAALSTDPRAVERFEREGAVLRQLNHPNIVKLITSIHEDDEHFLVMEYVRGGSLAKLLKQRQRLTINHTAQIALDLTDALIRVHRLEILHRDIKPANVLLDENNIPKLSDFGVARIANSSYTTNGVVGTLPYLPPEAIKTIEGHKLDDRSDIWAFGVMLFELLAGQRPFTGSNIAVLCDSIMEQPVPDLQLLRPDAPLALVDLIYRMLEKDVTHRIESARLVGVEIEYILNNIEKTESTVKLKKPLAKPAQSLNNLPGQVTPFVGREPNLAELDRLLTDPDNRLITIVGPGGIGKTRLAIEAAKAHIPKFANGVCIVDLSSITAPSFISVKIAEAINFKFYRVEEPEPQLLDYLRDKQMLLIMDNFEQFLENTTLIKAILAAAPGIKFLVTSQERLHLEAECVVEIEGMELSNWRDLTEAMESNAVKLFLQGATRVKPDFKISEADFPHLVFICQQVEGIPLGLLIAASWVETLSLKEIANELKSDINFLTTERRDIPARQRSMRAVFDYSWKRLSTQEQETYKKLAVFHKGFSREAALAVTGTSLRSLTILVNKSLIRRNANNRFEIHGLLRKFVEEQIDQFPDVKADVRSAHCRYYVAFMQDREPFIRADKEIEVMAEIEQDFDNIRLAWEWAVQGLHEDEIRQMLFTLDRFMGLRALYRQKLDMFQQAADKLQDLNPDPETPTLTLGIVLGFLSICYSDLGDAEKGIELNDRALAILRHGDAPRELAFTLLLRNWIIPSAVRRLGFLEESLAIFESIGDNTWLSTELYHLSVVLALLGDYENSRETYDRAISVAQQVGDRMVLALHAADLGDKAAARSDYDEAKAYYEEGLLMNQQLNNPQEIITFLERLAHIAFLQGDYSEAEGGYQEALTRSRDLGIRPATAKIMLDLADVAYAQGKYSDARNLCTEALTSFRKMKDVLVSLCWSDLGRIDAALGDYNSARDHIRKALKVAIDANIMGFVLEAFAAWAEILTKANMTERAVEVLSFILYNENALVEDRYLANKQYMDLMQQLPADVAAAAESRGKQLKLEHIFQDFRE